MSGEGLSRFRVHLPYTVIGTLLVEVDARGEQAALQEVRRQAQEGQYDAPAQADQDGVVELDLQEAEVEEAWALEPGEEQGCPVRFEFYLGWPSLSGESGSYSLDSVTLPLSAPEVSRLQSGGVPDWSDAQAELLTRLEAQGRVIAFLAPASWNVEEEDEEEDGAELG